MQDNDFEWDDDKATQNIVRHGVGFDVARLAFDDPFAVEGVDDREDYGEDRFALLGMVESHLLHVTFTYRGGRTRIISARAAEPYEHRRYHEEN
jgi:uncharacterized protein